MLFQVNKFCLLRSFNRYISVSLPLGLMKCLRRELATASHVNHAHNIFDAARKTAITRLQSKYYLQE